MRACCYRLDVRGFVNSRHGVGSVVWSHGAGSGRGRPTPPRPPSCQLGPRRGGHAHESRGTPMVFQFLPGRQAGRRDGARPHPGLRGPALARLVTEPHRAWVDLATLAAVSPLLATARRGDGHPVLVLPGLLTGDHATIVLRTVLRALGHNVLGWKLGTNRGSTGRVVQGLREHIDRLHQTFGQRVSLVGWSLGGLYAQELARATPGSVPGNRDPGKPGDAMGPMGAQRIGTRRSSHPPVPWNRCPPATVGRAGFTARARDVDLHQV